jgi:hypothetical protein
VARCFVLMGFGVKTDYRTNRALDLDKTYKIIRKAVVGAGHECIRADDIVHSGVIDKPMYEHLFEADIAIADLSTSNENAIYELGVRHALRPHTTIVIAESQFKFPFDLHSLLIRPYAHLGTGIDFEEAERLETELKRAIEKILSDNAVDSPVYTFMPCLKPPAMRAAGEPATPTSFGSQPDQRPPQTASADPAFSVMLDAFREARQHGDFTMARAYLLKLLKTDPNDVYLVQQLAIATYKIAPVTIDSLRSARDILLQLDPDKSGDPETLGIWGGIHKRIWEMTSDRAALDVGIAAYERGFYLKRDYYTGINYAFMLDDRAQSQEDPAEATADRVMARRIRRQLLAIVDEALEKMPRDENNQVQDRQEQYWLRATRLEALFGLGDPAFEQERDAVFAAAPESWMRKATSDQLARLATLLKAP